MKSPTLTEFRRIPFLSLFLLLFMFAGCTQNPEDTVAPTDPPVEYPDEEDDDDETDNNNEEDDDDEELPHTKMKYALFPMYRSMSMSSI